MNPTVLAALIQNRQRFLAFLAPRVGSTEIAEEVLQAAFLQGMESGNELRQEESAVAWFYRVLRNALIDRHRREVRTGRLQDALASEQALSMEDARALESTVCACVTSFISTLKEEYADVLQRVDLEGWSLANFAEEAGITPNNAKVRLHRARQALGRRLEQACGPSCCRQGCAECLCEPA